MLTYHLVPSRVSKALQPVLGDTNGGGVITRELTFHVTFSVHYPIDILLQISSSIQILRILHSRLTCG